MAVNFTAMLTDLGNGLGGFLGAITDNLVGFILVIGVVGGVIYIFYAIAKVIEKSVKGGRK